MYGVRVFAYCYYYCIGSCVYYMCVCFDAIWLNKMTIYLSKLRGTSCCVLMLIKCRITVRYSTLHSPRQTRQT